MKFLFCIIVVTVALLVSCQSSNSNDLEKYIKMIKNQPDKIGLGVPKINILSKNIDLMESDPFVLKVSSENEKLPSNARHALRSLPLSALTFVGQIDHASLIWGLIKGSNDLVVHVKVGDLIGKEKLKIIEIRKKSLVFEQRLSRVGKDQIKLICMPLTRKKS
jgi:type IV pilus assembly protein PilP